MINKVILIGNVGKDAVEKLAGETILSTFSVATTEKWRDSTGESREKTEWHNCVAHGATAEFLNENLKKGNKVYIEGKISNNDWEDKNKVKHYNYNIVCRLVRIL